MLVYVHISLCAASTEKCVFKHAQNVRIQILCMRKVLFAHLPSIETFYNVQWFCERTANAQIRLHGCAGWSGLRCLDMPEDTFSHGAALIMNTVYRDGAVAYRGAHFGQGVGQILLDNVACVGTETNIGQCRNNGAGLHNCDHNEDAGVSCSTGSFI